VLLAMMALWEHQGRMEPWALLEPTAPTVQTAQTPQVEPLLSIPIRQRMGLVAMALMELRAQQAAAACLVQMAATEARGKTVASVQLVRPQPLTAAPALRRQS
jgi:hypothetical protein